MRGSAETNRVRVANIFHVKDVPDLNLNRNCNIHIKSTNALSLCTCSHVFRGGLIHFSGIMSNIEQDENEIEKELVGQPDLASHKN